MDLIKYCSELRDLRAIKKHIELKTSANHGIYYTYSNLTLIYHVFFIVIYSNLFNARVQGIL